MWGVGRIALGVLQKFWQWNSSPYLQRRPTRTPRLWWFDSDLVFSYTLHFIKSIMYILHSYIMIPKQTEMKLEIVFIFSLETTKKFMDLVKYEIIWFWWNCLSSTWPMIQGCHNWETSKPTTANYQLSSQFEACLCLCHHRIPDFQSFSSFT